MGWFPVPTRFLKKLNLKTISLGLIFPFIFPSQGGLCVKLIFSSFNIEIHDEWWWWSWSWPSQDVCFQEPVKIVSWVSVSLLYWILSTENKTGFYSFWVRTEHTWPWAANTRIIIIIIIKIVQNGKQSRNAMDITSLFFLTYIDTSKLNKSKENTESLMCLTCMKIWVTEIHGFVERIIDLNHDKLCLLLIQHYQH